VNTIVSRTCGACCAILASFSAVTLLLPVWPRRNMPPNATAAHKRNLMPLSRAFLLRGHLCELAQSFRIGPVVVTDDLIALGGWFLVARSERFAACVTDLPTPITLFSPLSSMQEKFPVSG
jgi:hypothetical protein